MYAAQIWINKWLAYIIPSNLSHNEVTPDNIMKIVENNLLGFTVFYNKFISEENLHPIANAMNVLQIALQQGAKAVNIQNNNGKYQISINSQQLFGTSYPGIPSPTSVSYTPGAGYQLNK